MTAEITNNARVCGRCGGTIAAGATLYRATSVRLIRCRDCAVTLRTSLPTVELAAVTAIQPRPASFDNLRGRAGRMLRDVKQRQAGERA